MDHHEPKLMLPLDCFAPENPSIPKNASHSSFPGWGNEKSATEEERDRGNKKARGFVSLKIHKYLFYFKIQKTTILNIS